MEATVNHYKLTANGLQHYKDPTEPLKIGTKIYAILTGCDDICAVCSEPDKYGNQKIVNMNLNSNFRDISQYHKMNFKHCSPISKKFGIGYYWDDKENHIFSDSEIEKAIQFANKFDQILEQRRNEREAKRLQQVEQLKKDFSFLEINPNNDEKTTKKNIVAMLKRNFPETKFSVRKEHWQCYSINWTNGAAADEVEKIITLFSNHEFDSSGDFYDFSPSEFNRLFGSIKYLNGRREFSEDIEKFMEQFWGRDYKSEWKRNKSNKFLRALNIPNVYKSFSFDFESGYTFEV